MRRIMDPRKGSEYVIREILMPALRESYEDLLAAAEGADLLVSVAEQIVGAICERLERATVVALDSIVLFPAPI